MEKRNKDVRESTRETRNRDITQEEKGTKM